MTVIRALLASGLVGTFLTATRPAVAGRNDILVGLDSKIKYGPDGQHNVQPGADAVLVLDVADPARPRIRASLPLTNSLLGPPTNLQITPDGRLGLVANSVVDGAGRAAPGRCCRTTSCT